MATLSEQSKFKKIWSANNEISSSSKSNSSSSMSQLYPTRTASRSASRRNQPIHSSAAPSPPPAFSNCSG
jgi:hypothetical protein